MTELKRAVNEMTDEVCMALDANGLMDDFKSRPAYQRNDYLGWINRAKRAETKDKRLQQMLDELRVGGIYMKMEHPASRKNK